MGHLKTSFWEGAIMENENKIGEQNTSTNRYSIINAKTFLATETERGDRSHAM